MSKSSLSKPKELHAIFAENSPASIKLQLTRHCHEKKRRKLSLSEAEQTFCWMSDMGSMIVGDGFISIFAQFFGLPSFPRVCDALQEVGGAKLRTLLLEAWLIYTRDKETISPDEFHAIDVRRFNTKDKMARFEEIGEEVVAELEKQYGRGTVWAVEYAKRHRDEFTPIEGID